ncbi:MAG: hypothetical protein AB8B53_03665 [Flavobacteriales bacterium]
MYTKNRPFTLYLVISFFFFFSCQSDELNNLVDEEDQELFYSISISNDIHSAIVDEEYVYSEGGLVVEDMGGWETITWNSSIAELEGLKLNISHGEFQVTQEVSNADFLTVFSIGQKEFSNEENHGFGVTIEYPGFGTYTSILGDQTDSYFEIAEIEEEVVEGVQYVKAYCLFSCKVYKTENPTEFLSIENGEFLNYFKHEIANLTNNEDDDATNQDEWIEVFQLDDYGLDSHISGIVPFQDGLLLAYLKSEIGGNVSLSGYFDGSQLTHYYQNGSVTSSNFTSLKIIEENIYGVGIVGSAGALKFDSDQEQWIPVASDGSNFADFHIFNDSKIIATYLEPYIKSEINGSFEVLGEGMNDNVLALEIFNDELIAAGKFTSSGGTEVLRVAKWNGESWEAMGDGFDDIVYDLEIYDNKLIAVGKFSFSGTNETSLIAMWDGSVWQPLGTGIGGDVFDSARIAFANGNDLYVGGQFLHAGESEYSYLEKWNGSSWESMPSGIPRSVGSIGVIGNELFISNKFMSPSDVNEDYFLKIGI